MSQHYTGQRLSLRSQLCTVRYIGPVPDKTGVWLGVEWDDPTRGKNNGMHDGIRYFECRSKALSAASFLRSAQPWDKPRTFLQALKDKYFRIQDAHNDDVVFVSRSKVFEEVGFEKFAQRQAELKGIHVVVLDHMQIAATAQPAEFDEVEHLCTNITELDIGSNLFEDLNGVLELCIHMPKLTRLTLDGNRFLIKEPITAKLPNISTISLSDTLLNESELARCLAAFPSAIELAFANNGLQSLRSALQPACLERINLERNDITTLDGVTGILSLHKLQVLSLKENAIADINANNSTSSDLVLSSSLRDLDLSRNKINSWDLLNTLPHALPMLQSLRVSGNPLYLELRSVEGMALASEDGYMLTIARLPSLRLLNHSAISDKDRLNAEKYYLGQIAAQLSSVTPADMEAITAQHPRWQALCDEYGVPAISRRSDMNDIDPSSLAARLVTIRFCFEAVKPQPVYSDWTVKVPRSYSMYALYGLVGKHLDVMSDQLQLIWENGERDPVSHQTKYEGPQYWDSSDEESENGSTTWVMRAVELIPGTRSVGTYIEDAPATVRVKLVSG